MDKSIPMYAGVIAAGEGGQHKPSVLHIQSNHKTRRAIADEGMMAKVEA